MDAPRASLTCALLCFGQETFCYLYQYLQLGLVNIIAFSISFENDYPYLLDILDRAGIPLKSGDRAGRHPLVIAGGVACFLNPEPLAPFIDCFLIGEAEEILPQFFQIFEPRTHRKTVLKNLVHNVPGTYIPAFYRPRYYDDGTLAAFEPLADVPLEIKRVYLKDISRTSTCSAVVTPHTTLDRSFLVEVGRGCPHGCRFCSAGFIYRPPRFRPISQLAQTINQGARLTDRIGLVGAAVSDLPEIEKRCSVFGADLTGSSVMRIQKPDSAMVPVVLSPPFLTQICLSARLRSWSTTMESWAKPSSTKITWWNRNATTTTVVPYWRSPFMTTSTTNGISLPIWIQAIASR